MLGKRARAGACRSCRIRKRRCIPSEESNACQPCVSLAVPCSLVITRPGGQLKAAQPSDEGTSEQLLVSPINGNGMPHVTEEPAISAGTVLASPAYPVPMLARSISLLPVRSVLRELVELYFGLIHNGPHTLFHVPSFLAELDGNRAPEVLLMAMIALSARFYKGEDAFKGVDPRLRGQPYAAEGTRLLHEDMLKPSITTVQAALLLGVFFGGEGNAQAKHIYLGLARVHAQAIHLWEMPADSTVITREVRRRTWLSVVISDRWSAADMVTQSMISEELSSIFPIVGDIDFLLPQPDAKNLQAASDGLWSQMAKTIDVFSRISDMIQSVGSGKRTIEFYDVEIVQLANRLDHWHEKLPQQLVNNASNLEHFERAGLGTTFLSMHIGYHFFCQLLYYPFLDSRSRLQNSHFAKLCKEHASAITEISRLALDPGSNRKLVWFLNGHILVVASSVHLHTLLFTTDEREADLARQKLLHNFEIIMQLKKYWPVIDSSVARLRLFQNSCRSSMANSYVLDNWMMRFLAQHTTNIEPKVHSEMTDGLNVSGDRHTVVKAPAKTLPDQARLASLLHDKNLSNDVVVESALSWLLDD